MTSVDPFHLKTFYYVTSISPYFQPCYDTLVFPWSYASLGELFGVVKMQDTCTPL